MAEPLEIALERDNERRILRLEQDRVTIGRGRDADVQIEDPLASRLHCRLERLGAELFVVDLDSANGTWVDGVRVQRRPLGPGSVVRVGSTTLRLAGATAASRAQAAEATITQVESREREMLQTFQAVLRALDQEEKVERMAALLIDAAVALTRAERGFVFLVEQGQTTLALGRNFAREPVPAPERKVSRTLLGRALDSERPLLLQDAARDGQFAGVASISDLGLRSLLALPLRYQGEVMGLLVVDHRLASGAFQQDDVELLSGLATAAAMSLGAARDRREAALLRRRTAALQRQLGQRVRAEQEEAARRAAASSRFPGLLGASAAMQRLFAAMERVLASDVAVLIQGESGTGKELVAQALHFGGPRATKPFVTENCGALPDTLLESELFGHVKGAFTGATRDRAGRFEEADGGTLFLDEVSEMSPAMQARLLRALEDGEVRRLGADEVRKVDVRVIAATNSDLFELVRQGRFREDLYYRLKVVQLELPPLRQRQGDVALLAEHFLALEAAEEGRARRGLEPEAVAVLERYAWPGNVRELRNEMRRLTLLGEGQIRVEDISAEIRAGPAAAGDAGADRPLPERVASLEVHSIRAAMDASDGNRSRAARMLGISRFALLRKIEKYGLDPGTE